MTLFSLFKGLKMGSGIEAARTDAPDHARGSSRAVEVADLFKERGAKLFTLRRLADGTPAHPLMLPYTCRLEAFA